ncbi:probable serine/threonine-protein kinase PBL23 isoform X2 [Telopea speciosissima]|nr:probable serine/threonine-protein kinase PBL23 isoform X2 [Telopea speciosissima]
MGCSRGSYIDWKDTLNGPTGTKFKVIPFSVEDEFDDDEPEKRKIFKRNMIWELGLGCFLPLRRQGSHPKDKKQRGDNGDSTDHDEAWLLAESGSLDPDFMNADPQSVHSSFRFSFGSQMDLEALSKSPSISAATVLMVNLSTDLSESQSHDMKWRRIQSLERSISPVADTLVRFSYGEIRAATQNFSKDRVLGRGALSCVFKGRIGFLRKAVAIKRLNKEDRESMKAFCRELMIASSLHNRNIVLLKGFCIDPKEGLFLVYKYVSGGSLQYYLHVKKGVKGGSSLPWSVRFKVAVEIAEAVAYLHNGTEKCVVHRDIKPSNILLSSKKTPKLCDFGLATWTPAPSVPFLCKTVKGTFGYLAPEYFQHGKVSDKTDVYAFGVVLLELITGRKPIEDKRPLGDENLVLWAKPLLQRGSIKELLDPMLKLSPRDSNQLMKMIHAAAACIESEEFRRPSINQIVAILQGDEHYSSSRNISAFPGNDCVVDCYSHLQHKKSTEMRSHFALAMLGVSDLEEDNHLYCR